MRRHGVYQRLTCWADGPVYVTQCPIQAGQTYTYEFTIVEQRGTLFWHAHVSWLRATVHGAIVIYPKKGVPYPFPRPYEEQIIVFEEYFFKDAVKLQRAVLRSGGGAPRTDAYLINGHAGPRYNCSATDVYKVDVIPGKTYLLRLINAGLNQELYFSIAGHKMTIVESDAEYTKPFARDHIMIAPGQTINVLVKADQPIANYEMAVGPYVTAQNITFQNISAVAHFQYSGASLNKAAELAMLPAFNNNLVYNSHLDGLRSLNANSLPLKIDTNLFFTIGLNIDPCNRRNPNKTCTAPNGGIFRASMNNISFVTPSLSILQAYFFDTPGVFRPDFPKKPLKFYNFVYGAPNNIPNNTAATNSTRLVELEFGETVQLVMQNTGTITTENHPMHLHGFNFYVVGFGTGNYNPSTAEFNLVDPPSLNTIGVPVGGWAAIRFTANNPGVWFMHCHLDIHLSWGFSMAFLVKNGVGPLETLPHPPADLPRC
ncbi:laccase-6-like isoform X2 [Asparagus officinalis]|uniref:laccase-6-like isoform X2 n=1 Tax=Asparagus officinalis TaxID=4686 RepID=UPI00098E2D60|nr:laccase-6-like isoform X2 [Asparagus officinalis]